MRQEKPGRVVFEGGLGARSVGHTKRATGGKHCQIPGWCNESAIAGKGIQKVASSGRQEEPQKRARER